MTIRALCLLILVFCGVSITWAIDTPPMKSVVRTIPLRNLQVRSLIPPGPGPIVEIAITAPVMHGGEATTTTILPLLDKYEMIGLVGLNGLLVRAQAPSRGQAEKAMEKLEEIFIQYDRPAGSVCLDVLVVSMQQDVFRQVLHEWAASEVPAVRTRLEAKSGKEYDRRECTIRQGKGNVLTALQTLIQRNQVKIVLSERLYSHAHDEWQSFLLDFLQMPPTIDGSSIAGEVAVAGKFGQQSLSFTSDWPGPDKSALTVKDVVLGAPMLLGFAKIVEAQAPGYSGCVITDVEPILPDSVISDQVTLLFVTVAKLPTIRLLKDDISETTRE